MSEILSQVELIREAFHYQSRFEGSTMVFKIDYPVTEDPGFPYLMKDLALLAQTGFKIAIVPGAKEAIDAVLKQQGIVSVYNTAAYSAAANIREPARITTAHTLPFVEMAAFHVATRFMTYLSSSRIDAVIGNFVRARGLGVVDGIDMEHTGTVDKIFTDSISRVLNLGMVPILPCIGWSPAGKPYNVPSDEIALAVSAALGAVKLFIVSVYGGLRRGLFPIPEQIETRDDGGIVRLTPQEAESIVAAFAAQNSAVPNSAMPYGKLPQEAQAITAACTAQNTVAAPHSNLPHGNLPHGNLPHGNLPQTLKELRLALQASRAGVDRVHIIDGREEGAVLKELFSNLGTGTMIYADEYESIRPLHSRDLPDILRLMEPLMQAGILLRRTAEQIQEKKDDYVVFEIDGSVHACGALHDWGEAQGEIAAVATEPLYAGMNLGRRIVSYLIEKARKARMSRIFVLTTQTQDWFESLGFHEAPLDTLPAQKQRAYNKTRKSKVYALELG